MENQANIAEFTANTEESEEPETVRLKHLARINPTKSELSGLDPEMDVSFVPLKDFGTDGEIKDTETRQLEEVYDGYTYFREGDIAVAKITPSFENGKGAICRGLKNGIGFGTTELHVLRPRDGVSTQFLWYVLRSKPFVDEAEAAMKGVAGQQRVPSRFIQDFQIQDSEYKEYIGSYLSDIVPKIRGVIDKKEKLIKQLREKRHRLITKVATTGVRDNSDLRKTGLDFLDEIPSNWRVIRLKFLIDEIEQGWSPKCLETPSRKYEWGVLKAGAVNNGMFRPTENKTLPKETAPQKEYALNEGDVLMNRASGSQDLLGSIATVSEPCSKLLLCDKIYRLHPREEFIHPEFLVTSLQSHPVRYQIKNIVSGAKGLANNIPQGDLKNIQIAVPPKDEQDDIIQVVRKTESDIRSCIEQTQRSIDLLEEKRQALITAAVTGQIDVSDMKNEDKASHA